MRSSSTIGWFVVGIFAIGLGVIDIALAAQDECAGVVYINEDGGGGGISCSGDCVANPPPCTFHTAGDPEGFLKWCACGAGAQPECCHVVWMGGTAGHSVGQWGGCSPAVAGCPPGTCAITSVPTWGGGTKNTASCQ